MAPERVFLVSAKNDSLITAACAFEAELPDPSCPRPGLRIDLLLFMLHFLHPAPRVRLVRASGFDSMDRTPNDTSMLGLLYNGKADISYHITLNYDRGRFLRYATPFKPARVAYVVKKHVKEPVHLRLDELCPMFAKAFAIVWFGILVVRKVLLFIVLQCPVGIVRSYHLRVNQRAKVWINLGLAIFLGCLSSHLTMIFNLPTPHPPHPVTSIEDLASVLESGQYKSVYTSNLYLKEMLNPVSYQGKASFYDRLIKAAKRNPPIKTDSVDEAISLLLSGGNYVYIMSEDDSRLLEVCGLSMTIDDDFKQGFRTVFMSPTWNLSRNFNSIQIEQIQRAEELLRKSRYRPEKAFCTPEAPKVEAMPVIHLKQLQGAFSYFLVILANCVVVFLLELIIRACLVCLDQGLDAQES